ncbi:MAG: ABC transporter permease [Gemmatimonadota bacterium]
MRDRLARLRSASLQLLRDPAFAIGAILLLGLGIGASTAVFAFVRGILLRPLPFAESERVVILCETNEAIAGHCVAAPPNALDWADRARTLESIGQGREWSFLLRHGDQSKHVNAGLATPRLFEVLRTQPLHGRLFAPTELTQDDAPVAILSHELWSVWFNADRSVVGRRVELDGRPFTLIGVLPPAFRLPNYDFVELWVPFHFNPRDEERRSWRGFVTLARLAPGATREQAAAELSSIQQQLAIEHPATNEGWGVSVASLKSHVVRGTKTQLVVFSAAIGLLLLITCANLAALLLVRASARQHEFALRVALGASTRRIAGLIINEAVVIGLAAGALAFLVAWSAVRMFSHFAPATLPRLDEISVDASALLFAFALAMATALLVAAWPAWRTTRVATAVALREGARQLTDRFGLRLRRALVVVEIAVALTLLVGSALLVRSFTTLVDWQPGIPRERLIVVSLSVPNQKYTERTQLTRLFQQLERELAAQPGIEAVGTASAGPLFGGEESGRFRVEGRDYPDPKEAATLRWYDAAPEYLNTLGLPLRRGRRFAESDHASAPAVAIINEAAQRRYFADRNPVGQRIRWLEGEQSFEIVGVVADVRPFDPSETAEPEIYFSNRQLPRWFTYFVARTRGEPAAQLRTVETVLQRNDPDLQVGTARALDELVDRRLIAPRFQMLLIGCLALVALALAAAGVFGVLAYTVALRTTEFGIRAALGARPGQTLRGVLIEAVVLYAAGAIFGVAGALVLARAMSGLLFGTPPTHPVSYILATLVLFAVCLLASALPALRAARVQPMAALRM